MSFIAVILLSGDTLAVGHKCLFLRGRAALPSSWPRLRSEGGAGPNGVRHGAASREFLAGRKGRQGTRRVPVHQQILPRLDPVQPWQRARQR